MAKVPVSMADKQKSYYKYYAEPIYKGPQERYDEIKKGLSNNADAHRVEDRNDLFMPGYMPGEFGYWILENGTAIVANNTFFPNVNGEIFDWWFAWHPIDRLRYACWDNLSHYGVYLEDTARARDLSKSMRERHWGSIHHIWEDIGLGNIDLLKIHFLRPSEMGYDESKIDTDACCSLICGNAAIIGNENTPDAAIVMTHFLRPVEGGAELRSRFWFGYHIIDGKLVKLLPDGAKIPEAGPRALLSHNVEEYSNLARILPLIYAEEKNNWF